MKKIWAVANQKGGVGKTTTAVTLAGQLSAEGERVLLIDLDPHGSLTTYFGHDPDAIELSVYTLFKDRADKRAQPRYDQVLVATAFDNLSLLPASTALATLDRQLGAEEGMGLVIARTLQDLADRFDYVFMDCPPMLGVLMVNALAACDQLLIPVQCEFLALKGLERMLHTLEMIARARGDSPAHLIVPTMYDRRTRASGEALDVLRQRYPDRLWQEVIPVDTQFREASKTGKPLSLSQRSARGARAYARLLDFLLQRASADEAAGEPTPRQDQAWA
ncbi:ParA family protein [Thiohalobacter thiocyanaticus]|uniref:ParA family protein n=1 Tax=Thiohalobacter thiocyanaticus TaxID=585455 RepID=A0A426QGM8_9GAMM|nr:ParA family protein [Thiohalobacter thiocyanaticus]RRQ20893.1 ParA family protein [Thiohalobacter thiocyanaticus]